MATMNRKQWNEAAKANAERVRSTHGTAHRIAGILQTMGSAELAAKRPKINTAGLPAAIVARVTAKADSSSCYVSPDGRTFFVSEEQGKAMAARDGGEVFAPRSGRHFAAQIVAGRSKHWVRGESPEEVAQEVLLLIDAEGYGARDVGGRFALFDCTEHYGTPWLAPKVGTVSFNGRVELNC